MKRLLASLAAAIVMVVALTPVASAAYNPLGTACNLNGNQSSNCQNQSGDGLTGSDGVFIKVVKIIAYLAGASAIILIIVSGIQFATAGGDSNKISQARNTIIYALVGLVVIIAAQAIITYVIKEVM